MLLLFCSTCGCERDKEGTQWRTSIEYWKWATFSVLWDKWNANENWDRERCRIRDTGRDEMSETNLNSPSSKINIRVDIETIQKFAYPIENCVPHMFVWYVVMFLYKCVILLCRIWNGRNIMFRGVGRWKVFGLYIDIARGMGKRSETNWKQKKKMMFPFHPLGNISKRRCALMPYRWRYLKTSHASS
jgi:hypothetical protein